MIMIVKSISDCVQTEIRLLNLKSDTVCVFNVPFARALYPGSNLVRSFCYSSIHNVKQGASHLGLLPKCTVTLRN